MTKRVVLHAEEDEDDALLFAHAMQKAQLPFQIIHVSNGQQAITYLSGQESFSDRTKHPVPDFIMLDLNMPIQNGFEVLDWARRQTAYRNTPIYILSASDFASDRQCAQLLGATKYFVKTHNFSSVIDHFRTLPGATPAPA